jgi:hypothetical protein
VRNMFGRWHTELWMWETCLEGDILSFGCEKHVWKVTYWALDVRNMFGGSHTELWMWETCLEGHILSFGCEKHIWRVTYWALDVRNMFGGSHTERWRKVLSDRLFSYITKMKKRKRIKKSITYTKYIHNTLYILASSSIYKLSYGKLPLYLHQKINLKKKKKKKNLTHMHIHKWHCTHTHTILYTYINTNKENTHTYI